MSKSGIAAMVQMGAWCDNQLALEVLSIGRSVEEHLSGEDCVLELVGRFLAYLIALRGGWVWLYGSLSDSADEPELLLRAADGGQGWRDVARVVRLLEREQVRSLEKPIELGLGGPNGIVIG
jgi:hypothetical protein